MLGGQNMLHTYPWLNMLADTILLFAIASTYILQVKSVTYFLSGLAGII
jgi:hypothetical protein